MDVLHESYWSECGLFWERTGKGYLGARLIGADLVVNIDKASGARSLNPTKCIS